MKWWFIGGIAVIVAVMGLALYATAPLARPQNDRYLVIHTGAHEPGEQGEENEGGGTLVLALSAEPDQIDPQAGSDAGLKTVLPYLFDTLVTRDADRGIVPDIAQSWDFGADGTLTMHLEPGVYFQDGDPLTADSVRGTFERFKQVGRRSPIYNTISQIARIDVLDDLTVRFSFQGSGDELLSALATPWAGIISPESGKAQPGERRMIGTGPFMLGDWQKGESITLIRNNGYLWGPEVVQNRRPVHVQALLLKVMPDVHAQVAALQARQVDVLLGPPEQESALKSDPGLAVNADGLAYRKGIFGLKLGALHDVLVNDVKVPGN